MDEELIGQIRDVSGDRVVTCDLCGLPTSEVSVVVLERISPADPEVEVRVCPSCRRKMQAGELPVTIDGDLAGPEEGVG